MKKTTSLSDYLSSECTFEVNKVPFQVTGIHDTIFGWKVDVLNLNNCKQSTMPYDELYLILKNQHEKTIRL